MSPVHAYSKIHLADAYGLHMGRALRAVNYLQTAFISLLLKPDVLAAASRPRQPSLMGHAGWMPFKWQMGTGLQMGRALPSPMWPANGTSWALGKATCCRQPATTSSSALITAACGVTPTTMLWMTSRSCLPTSAPQSESHLSLACKVEGLAAELVPSFYGTLDLSVLVISPWWGHSTACALAMQFSVASSGQMSHGLCQGSVCLSPVTASHPSSVRMSGAMCE